MERIEVFECDGKQVIYFNLSEMKYNEELCDVVKKAKEIMSKYQPASVYTITNINRIAFDSKTKEIAADWMSFNKPFVIKAAFFGVSGTRKIMMSAVFKLCKRTNVKLLHDMDEALDWIKSL